MPKTLYRVRITTIEFLDVMSNSPESAIEIALSKSGDQWELEASTVSTHLEKSDVPASREA